MVYDFLKNPVNEKSDVLGYIIPPWKALLFPSNVNLERLYKQGCPTCSSQAMCGLTQNRKFT